MKTTIVPAQVTTTEDKIMGNISVSQLILLVAPIFFGGIFYALFPPSLKFAYYKVAFMALIFFIFATLAIRIKGKLVFQWLMIFHTYNSRPRHYVYSKNTSHLRDKPISDVTEINEEAEVKEFQKEELDLDLTEAEQAMYLMDPKVSLKLSKKGGFYVTVSKVE